MFDKIIHFLKYNNATIIILAIILVLGGGALAAGPEAIGVKQTSVQGLDNTVLLAADLEKFNMDFKIENIQADEKYYYVTYSYLDIVEADNVWQYQLSQSTRKVSKKIKQDIGAYMADYLAKQYEARLRELTGEKNMAQSAGEQRRLEVTEYSGLVGRTLDLAAKFFPGYEPVKKVELPAPQNFAMPQNDSAGPAGSGADNLTQIYNDYVASHPEIMSRLEASSTPAVEEVPTAETPAALPVAEPTDVQVIDLPPAEPIVPVAPEATPAEPAPVEPTPESAESGNINP